jgi:hypothetical protein
MLAGAARWDSAERGRREVGKMVCVLMDIYTRISPFS